MGLWQRRYYRVLNALMRALLCSPFHMLCSGRVLLLELSGRRSHKRYRMPVSYWQRSADQIVCLTSTGWSRWWVNLDDADLVLRLYGRNRPARASLVAEPEIRLELVSGFLRHNARDAHHYGVGRDDTGRPLDADLETLAEDPATKVIDIRLRQR
jgi:hypothetical protein